MSDLIARAKARIDQMNKTADEVTKELGLPPEAKYTVLSLIFGAEPELSSASVASSTEAAGNNAGIKARIYSAVNDFLNQRRKRDLGKFQILWEEFKQLPVETLVSGLVQAQATGGLGFSAPSQELAAITSTISWVTTQDEATKQQLTESRIVEEATARGCSYALSFALAQYLRQTS